MHGYYKEYDTKGKLVLTMLYEMVQLLNQELKMSQILK